MTLTQLKYATAVARASSMNEAARTLFISQPSLSTAIKELEDEIYIKGNYLSIRNMGTSLMLFKR